MEHTVVEILAVGVRHVDGVVGDLVWLSVSCLREWVQLLVC